MDGHGNDLTISFFCIILPSNASFESLSRIIFIFIIVKILNIGIGTKLINGLITLFMSFVEGTGAGRGEARWRNAAGLGPMPGFPRC